MFELYPSNKFILRGEDYTVCSRWGVCVVKLQPSFGGDFWILGDVFIEVILRKVIFSFLGLRITVLRSLFSVVSFVCTLCWKLSASVGWAAM